MFRERECRKELHIEYKIKRKNYAENKNVGNKSAGGNVQITNVQEKVSGAFLGSNMHKRSF
jgi:hypothetical protein